MILILTVGGVIVGCSPNADKSQNPENPQNERILELMSGISSNIFCVILEDTQAALSLTQKFGNNTFIESEGLLEHLCQSLGIDIQAVTYNADIYPFGPKFLLGEFNLDDIRAHLAENGFHRSDREGIETWWDNENEDSAWVMLHGNLTVYGADGGPGNEYSDSCIRALAGDDKSLDEDSDFRDIIDDFPGAVSYDLSHNPEYSYDAYRISGGLVFVDEEIIRVIGLLEFKDAHIARANQDKINEDLKETYDYIEERLGPNAKISPAQVTGKYIVYTVEIEADEYFKLMASTPTPGPIPTAAPTPTPKPSPGYGSVSGHVYQEDGITPIQGLLMKALTVTYNDGAVSSIAYAQKYTGYTDEEGSYIIENLPPGKYLVSTWSSYSKMPYVDESYALDLTSIPVGQNENVGNIDFVLAVGGTISGHVYQEDGVTPIPNLYINVSDYDNRYFDYLSCYAYTKEDGSYTVYGLASGKYRVMANPGYTYLPFSDKFYDDTYDYLDAVPVRVIAPNDTPDIGFKLDRES